MSDKVQLIKEEIKRLKQTNGFLPVDNYDICDAYRARGYQFACDDILQFIELIPEDPADKDLKEELNSWMGENCDDNGFFDPLELACHFVEWQKEKHNKQFGFLNLKDCKDAYNEWKSTQDEPSAALAWARACEWQRNQITKDAVEADAFNTKN